MSQFLQILLAGLSIGAIYSLATLGCTTFKRLRDEFHVSIPLVEQNAKAALKLADRGYVLINGRITNSDASKGLLADSATQGAFLCRTHSAGAG